MPRPRSASIVSSTLSSAGSVPLHERATVRVAVEPSRIEDLEHEIDELEAHLQRRGLASHERAAISAELERKEKALDRLDKRAERIENAIKNKKCAARSVETEVEELRIPPKLLELLKRRRLLRREVTQIETGLEAGSLWGFPDRELLYDAEDKWDALVDEAERYKSEIHELEKQLEPLTSVQVAERRLAFPEEDEPASLELRRARALEANGFDPSAPNSWPPTSAPREVLKRVGDSLGFRRLGRPKNGTGSVQELGHAGHYRLRRRYFGEEY